MKEKRVTKENAVVVKNLVKQYKKSENNAVDDITFNVENGEFFSLLGPNGAGKTTTISILTTTLNKTKGQITIAGYDIDKNQSEVRRNIGIIFQNPSLDMNLTAEENVRLHSLLYGLYSFAPSFSLMNDDYKKKVFELGDILGIKNDMFKPIKTFSGGMKRKLEIMRSLIHKPKILFLDEPTSGLDPLSRKNLWDYLKDVQKKEKTTIFLTTHYLEEAEGADNIVIINKGKVVADGAPTKIKENLIKKYVNINAKDKETLRKEIEKTKLKFTGNGPFKVTITNDNEAKELIRKISVSITELDIHNPTLEDAYLEIVGHNTNGNSKE
jgi:ABC-2 type transport system ATP-binding protein